MKNKMKCIFFGTPDFSVPALEILSKKAQVSLVVTQEDKRRGRGKKLSTSPVKDKALELGIEVFQPRDINSQGSLDKLRSYRADLFVIVAYGQILKKDLLSIPKLDIVNIHASLLPKLRGAAPIQYAILQGHSKTGVCIMRIEEGLDSGPVALRKEIEIIDQDAGQLSDQLSELGAQALGEFLDQYQQGQVVFVDQNHDQATYAPKITNEMAGLDFYTRSARELERLVRALSPRPGARFSLGKETYKVYKASVVRGGNLNPGQYRISKKDFLIGSPKDALSIQEIQRQGKRKNDIASFLAGYKTPEDGLVNEIERS